MLPLKVKLELGVAPFFVFTVVSELGAEVADGTFVKQSQVRVMSAKASGLNKTQVDINIVPLRNKLDNITASVIYQRFWQKKVPINKTLFGDFEVIFVQYPGNREIYKKNFLSFFFFDEIKSRLEWKKLVFSRLFVFCASLKFLIF